MRNLYSVCLLSILSTGFPHKTEAYPTNDGNGIQCGKVARRSSRIINGSIADEMHFPSMASIKKFGYPMCGGTIISGRYILSAGHCLIEANEDWTVTLGEYNLEENEDFSVSYSISEVINYPGFGAKNLVDNDIMLLKLSDDIKWSNHIRPICLPSEDIETHSDAIAAGWGYDTNFLNTDANNKLRFVQMEIFKNDYCNDIYKKKNLKMKLNRLQMCAGKLGEEVRDTSSGDSGGPLLIESKGRQVIVGITSSGTSETGYPRAPGVYTRVFQYMNWILENIQQVQYYPAETTTRQMK